MTSSEEHTPIVKEEPHQPPGEKKCVEFPHCMNFNRQAQEALLALQVAEAFLIHLFEDACLLHLHTGYAALFPKDVPLARRILCIQEGLG